jgi:hypothetical protein
LARATVLLMGVLLLTACQESAPGLPIRGVVTAGPVCPVVTDPPDPACEDRPVGGAEIVVTDSSGAEVARVESEEDGTFLATVPAAGRYSLTPQPVDGLLGTAPAVDVVIQDAEHPPVVIVYDTGIR